MLVKVQKLIQTFTYFIARENDVSKVMIQGETLITSLWEMRKSPLTTLPNCKIVCVLKDHGADCVRSSTSLRLVECIFLHCPEIQRKKIRRSRRGDATNRAGEETPCNVNEHDCKHRNDRRQFCFALILVRV